MNGEKVKKKKKRKRAIIFGEVQPHSLGQEYGSGKRERDSVGRDRLI
jgi:hypothetical protein